MPNWVSTLYDHSHDRAFNNLFEVNIIWPDKSFPNTNNYNMNPLPYESKYYVEDITLGSQQITLGSETSMKIQSPTGITKISKITLKLRETSKFEFSIAIQKWMNQIYDFEQNCFLNYYPYAKIEVLINERGENIAITMDQAFPISLTLPSFAWKGSEPLLTSCDFTVNNVKIIQRGE